MENLFGIGIIILLGLIVLGATVRPQPPAQPPIYVLLSPAAANADQDTSAGALVLMLLSVLIALALFQV